MHQKCKIPDFTGVRPYIFANGTKIHWYRILDELSNFFYGTYPMFVFVRFSKVSWDDPIWMFLYEHERIIFDYVQINFFNTQFLSTALSLIDHPWNYLSSSIFLRSMSMALFFLIKGKCSMFSGQQYWDQGFADRLVNWNLCPTWSEFLTNSQSCSSPIISGGFMMRTTIRQTQQIMVREFLVQYF